MPTTPGQPPAPRTLVRLPCAICGATLDVPPNAVTVNVPLLTVQYACGHCAHITTKRIASKAVLASLLSVGADFVPRGVDDESRARELAALWGADTVPQWPAVTP